MTQLESGQPTFSMLRGANAATGIPRQGVTESLNAPGLVPLPPVSKPTAAMELAEALGVAGGAFGAIGALADREVARREHEAREVEHRYRGQASLDARTALPDIMRRIENRDMLVPDGVPVEEHVRGLLDEQLADLPEAYAEQYRQALQPQLAAAFVAQQQVIKKQTQAEDLQLLSEAAIQAQDTGGVAAVLAEARQTYPNMSETELLDAVVVPKLRSAVAAGDRERFEAGVAALNGRFPGMVAELRPQLEASYRSRVTRAENEQWDAARESIAQQLDQESPNYEALVETVDAMDIPAERQLQLKGTVHAHQRQEQQRRQAQLKETIDDLANRNPSVASYREAIDGFVTAGGLSRADGDALVNNYVRDRVELAAQRGDYQTVEALAGEFSDDPQAQTFLETQRAEAVNRFRARQASQIIAELQSGATLPADAARMAVAAAERFAANNDDPTGLRPEQVSQIQSAARARGDFDLATQQVAAALQGANVTLVESEHKKAIDDTLGPQGLGLIDAGNRIADPAGLAGAILTAEVTTPFIRDTLVANLTRSDPQQSAAAAQVIGQIGVANSRLFAQLSDHAGASMVPALEAARENYRRGRLQDEATAPAAIEEIRAALAIDTDIAPREEVIADLRRDQTDIVDVANQVVDAARDFYPQATDRFWIIDFLNPDPGLDTPAASVHQQVQKWYTDRFAALNRDKNMPRETAKQKAAEYAGAKFRQNVDLVRWDNQLQPVLIDDGRGLRLPEDVRWGEGFEDAARADLKEAGFDPDDVVSMKPYLQGRAGEMGWLYVDTDGDVIRDDDGSLIIFRPVDELRRRNAEFRKLLEQKAQDFNMPVTPPWQMSVLQTEIY